MKRVISRSSSGPSLGLLGANGAGKIPTVETLEGFCRASDGAVAAKGFVRPRQRHVSIDLGDYSDWLDDGLERRPCRDVIAFNANEVAHAWSPVDLLA